MAKKYEIFALVTDDQVRQNSAIESRHHGKLAGIETGITAEIAKMTRDLTDKLTKIAVAANGVVCNGFDIEVILENFKERSKCEGGHSSYRKHIHVDGRRNPKLAKLVDEREEIRRAIRAERGKVDKKVESIRAELMLHGRKPAVLEKIGAFLNENPSKEETE